MERCPGGDLRNLHVDDITCVNCGASVELFSDEQRRACPKCGVLVTRETVPMCASWCTAAERCMGEDRYAEALESGQIETPGFDEGEGQADS